MSRFYVFKNSKLDELYFSDEKGVLVSGMDYSRLEVDNKTLKECYLEIVDIGKWIDDVKNEKIYEWGTVAEWI